MSTKQGAEPGEHDVLCGRGAMTNLHPGNKSFRALVAQHQPTYITAKKEAKEGISRTIVATVQGRGGKFVMKDPTSGEWVPVEEKKAILKTSQALREGMNVRKTTTEGSPGEKAAPISPKPKTSKNAPKIPFATARTANQPIASLYEPKVDARPPPKIHTPATMPTGSAETNGTLTENDVLCGRGGGTNAYVGNIKFRAVVAEHQPRYLVCKRAEKETIAGHIVNTIRARGGRFLSKNQDYQWVEVGEKKAILKCSQALREGMNVRGGTLKSPERESKFAAAVGQGKQPAYSSLPPAAKANTAASIVAKLPTMPRPQLEAVARAMLCSGSSEAIDAAVNAVDAADDGASL